MERMKNYINHILSFMTFLLMMASSGYSAIQTITIDLNTAKTIHLDNDTAEVFVANPTIADVQLNSPKAIYIYGKSVGTTSFMATNIHGETTLNLQIKVQQNFDQAKQLSNQIAPEGNIEIISGPTGTILEGEVKNPQQAHQIESIIQASSEANTKIVNNLVVDTPTQVYLKVKIAEVSRTVLNRLDINWASALNSPAHFAFGMMTGARAPLATDGTFVRIPNATNQSNSIGARFNDGKLDLGVLLDALNKENLASLLAEPNLVALSGQTASFLVGGEVPILIPQGQNISIEYKQVGISLSFTPTILASNRINLRVKPEVSQIDTAYSTQISANGQSINIPGISTRRAETSVELASGQSLAIAGLFSRKLSNTMAGIPGLADLPILGALFKSTEFARDETELVIIVTPYTVQPTTGNALALPTDSIYHSTNLDMLLFNKINLEEPAKAELAGNLHILGAAGFYIN